MMNLATLIHNIHTIKELIPSGIKALTVYGSEMLSGLYAIAIYCSDEI